MRIFAFSVVSVSAAVLLSGCLFPDKVRQSLMETEKKNFQYLGSSSERAQLEIPTGFEVSPEQAIDIFYAARGIRKTALDIYHGIDRYYIVDAFLGSTPTDGVLYGTIIDGKTGQVFDSESQTWFSVTPIRDRVLTETDPSTDEN